ncbi:MAG: hypothetical protein HY079_04795 [Elusimicrobia bacterium]|nr:hypothetical protein [Elusimicrobiota bacterium]
MKPLALLLLLSVPAVALDWDKDPLTQVAESLPAAPPSPALECRPEVIAAFKQAWTMADRGRAEYEAAFRVDREDDGRLAIAHTHPDDAEPTPGPKDHLSPVPNFVISRGELYVTVPGTRDYRRARWDWAAPCGPREG